MPDLNPNINYGALPPQVNTPGVVPVRETLQDNPVSRVAEDMFNVKDAMFATLYGAIASVAAYLGNEKLVNTRAFQSFLDRIDNNNTLQRASDAIERGWQGIKGSSAAKAAYSPFKGLVEHFKRHWHDVQPKNGMAIMYSRPKEGQIVDSLLGQAMKPFNKAKRALQGFGPWIDKDIERLLQDVKSKKNLNEIERRLRAKGKFNKKAQKALDLMRAEGKKAARLNDLMGRWSSNRSYRWDDALDEFKKIIGNSPSKGVQKTLNQINAAAGLNAGGKGKTVFSRTLRGLYKHTNDYFNLHYLRNNKILGPGMTLISAAFLGNTIHQTIKAEKGDKVSTFMEGFLGDVLPFALMDKTVQAIYGTLGGLQGAGQSKWLAPVRGIGRFFGMGLEKAQSSLLRSSFGGIMRIALMFTGFFIVGDLSIKLSHMLFGKSQKTIREEQEEQAEKEKEKAEKEGKTEPEETISNNINTPPPPMVQQYLNRINRRGLAQNSDPPPMVESYMNRLQTTGSYSPIPTQGIGSRSLLTGRKSYYAVPEPINETPPETIERLNTVIAKVDKMAERYGV